MELPLAVVAILVALVALGLALSLRTQVAQLPREDSSADVERLRQELIELRSDLEHAQRELEQLKAATQVPAPPLPRARSAALSDLREQLRAAHREPEPGSDE